jgi:hypothetical protein
MLELVVAVCMIDEPARCKDVHLALESAGRVTAQQCFMHSQFEMARWVGENPMWQVKRWSCADAGVIAKVE